MPEDCEIGGIFVFKVIDKKGVQRQIQTIASNGMGWEHVSVSYHKPPGVIPSWEVMCFIKDQFWDADDVVVQFHPAKKDYVNVHKFVLHLWRRTGQNYETPPTIMIG